MKQSSKIAVLCLLGSLAFAAKPLETKAAEIPVAGIDVILSNYYSNTTNSEIKELLEPINSTYDSIGIAQVNNYINIRSKSSEKSKIVGKLYENSAATILDKDGEWYKIKSGTVTGYVKSEYLVTGEEVESLAKKVGKRYAIVTTTTLKVREKASLDAPVETLVPDGEELMVKKEMDDWVKVSIDSDIVGYVSSEYVKIKTVFKEAESLEEEQMRLETEARNNEAENRVYNTESSSNNNSSQTERLERKPVANNSKNSNKSTYKPSSSSSSLRNRIVEYALKFEGNPYVWGGTSLTNGADCSGFTQSVFRDNGISISRTSRTQATGGREISLSQVQPGDLIFYDRNGTINHVGIYIGNGKLISASSPETGIRITNYTYRQPFKVVSYID